MDQASKLREEVMWKERWWELYLEIDEMKIQAFKKQLRMKEGHGNWILCEEKIAALKVVLKKMEGVLNGK